MKQITRRQFGQQVALAGALSALSVSRVLGAQERIRVGFIGVGNRGDQLLDAFLKQKDCQIVAVCDLYAPYRDFACRKITQADSSASQVAQYDDYRRLLERKDVDAVVISTPDHWHALQTIHAFQAGKDVYVEKPLSLCVVEGRKMAEACRRYQRVCQVGLQRRSSPMCRELADFLRQGGIGKITRIRAFHVLNEWPKGIGRPPDEPPPPDVNWDAWLGPAPVKPYNRNRTFYRFRWFYDYSGGQLTNFGVHYLDMIHWCLGVDKPLAVTAMGGKFADYDNREVPDTLEVLWTYPGSVLVSFSQINANAAAGGARPCEIEFRGTQGTAYLSYGSYEIVPEVITSQEVPARTPLNRALEREYRKGAQTQIAGRKQSSSDSTELHVRNFLDCVRSRKSCNSDIESGHRSTVAPLIGNIALRLKRYLEWDGEREGFVNCPEANRLLSYDYRPPYKLPD
ncbi:MAG: Gfo/Idh/MocA family oxidoreductase [Gemmatales bacterium]|nr:Gfo/Idh/MocA family oxidoreductase [Gemmatales bacterium]MCS7159100.1 Gfo/Idh/MocA family oxidoreductase [Gemmatales bacterium]MDW8174300.1 Gfo/Idh/MocA family oxidoreductase [Gemmatales bacterium]MDW8222162.1 Gfo/Idh/MocA family oxidoreductase [Gemmatales bacterium]